MKTKKHKFTAKELYDAGLSKNLKKKGWRFDLEDAVNVTAFKNIARYINKKTGALLLLLILLSGCASNPMPQPHTIYLPGNIEYSDKE